VCRQRVCLSIKYMETRRVREERLAARIIQHLLRSKRVKIPIPTMAAFFVNPYSQVLNLSDKSYLKLYTDGCKGLERKIKFDGKRENFNDFVKLISQKMSNRKVKECLAIATEWATSGENPEQPTIFKDIFATSKSTSDEITDHCDRI